MLWTIYLIKGVRIYMSRPIVHHIPAKHAVKVKSVYSSFIGRPCKKKRYLDINAPMGDFAPVKPGNFDRSTTGS